VNSVIEQTQRICRVTHTDLRCLASCVAISTSIALILQHFRDHESIDRTTVESIIDQAFEYAIKELDDTFNALPETEKETKREVHTKELKNHMYAQSFTDLELDEGSAIGYTFKAMGCAFVALRKLHNCDQEEFELILSELTREAGDADSNACVAMAVVGALIGFNNITSRWVSGLPHRQWMERRTEELFAKLFL
jgi:ADP-ribosylglycohydrolase